MDLNFTSFPMANPYGELGAVHGLESHARTDYRRIKPPQNILPEPFNCSKRFLRPTLYAQNYRGNNAATALIAKAWSGMSNKYRNHLENPRVVVYASSNHRKGVDKVNIGQESAKFA